MRWAEGRMEGRAVVQCKMKLKKIKSTGFDLNFINTLNFDGINLLIYRWKLTYIFLCRIASAWNDTNVIVISLFCSYCSYSFMKNMKTCIYLFTKSNQKT